MEGSPLGEFRRLEVNTSLSEVRLLAPVQPGKIICVGRNYVAHGKIWFSQPILEKILEPDAAESRSVSEAGLTRRELEVLRLMARGWDIDLTKQNKCAKM